MTPHPPPALRERTRRAVHREIADAALELFLTQGFDATTVDQIAAAAGISRRSFFRYFAAKEDVVIGDFVERGHVLRDALAARPDAEDPWDSLIAAFVVLRDRFGDPTAAELRVARLLHSEPSLRARRLEKQLAWQDALVPELTRRLAAESADAAMAKHRAGAMIACALACLDVAVDTWVDLDGARGLEELWRDAIDVVRRG